MSDSALVSYRQISPNCNSPRNHKIDMVVIHCMAGPMSVEGCGACFAPVSRQASSNYGVGPDGRIGQYCWERDRSWCTCSPGIDNRAITIEVSNIETVEPFRITEKAYNALINLLVDICRRNGMPGLKWKDDRNLAYQAERGGSVAEQNMVVHRWFEAKSCPGQYLYSIQGKIAEEVNRRLANKTPITGLPEGTVVVPPSGGGRVTPTTPTTPSTPPTAQPAVTRLEVDYKKIKPYIITLGRNRFSTDWSKLKSSGVCGALLEAGSYYTAGHVVAKSFMNPELPTQVNSLNSAKLRYGLYMPIRAQSAVSAKFELDALKQVVRKYRPRLGVWLYGVPTSSVSLNDTLLNTYRTYLEELGFKSQIGLYITPTQLKQITWSKHKQYWLLWINEHVGSVSELDKLLDPEFFDMNGRYN